MKIAIPTRDGLHISSVDEELKGYHVYTISLGEIVNEELRWNDAGRIKSGPARITDLVKDCSVILVKEADTGKFSETGEKTIVPVSGSLITKIIWNYLSTVFQEASNTCCCP